MCLLLAPYCLLFFVVPGRVELPTSTLSVQRSNQLSYRTGFHFSPLVWALYSVFNDQCLVIRKTSLHLSLITDRLSLYLYHKQHNVVLEKFDFSCIPLFQNKSYKSLLIHTRITSLQKGGVPAAPSGTATLLRLSPSYQFYPRTLLAVTYFRSPQLPWLDGRCVQGPGTYSPRHG